MNNFRDFRQAIETYPVGTRALLLRDGLVVVDARSVEAGYVDTERGLCRTKEVRDKVLRVMELTEEADPRVILALRSIPPHQIFRLPSGSTVAEPAAVKIGWATEPPTTLEVTAANYNPLNSGVARTIDVLNQLRTARVLPLNPISRTFPKS